MVNFSLDSKDVFLNPKKYECSILHECVHIMYNSIAKQRVVWFDEGLAMNLSGEGNPLLEVEHLKNFMTHKIFAMNLPDDMNTLIHGEKFVNKEYNGYDLSYLAVRYLLETREKEEIRELIRNSDKVLELGQEVLPCAMEYFSNKISVDSNTKGAVR